MNTASLDSSSTESAPTDSSTDENETQRIPAIAPMSPSRSDGNAPETLDERSVVRLVRTPDRPPAPKKTTVDERPAPLSIAVLTNDAAFATQFRAATDDASTVAQVANLDAAASLAAEGRCAILVTDLATTRSVLEALTHRLRAHDPALAVVVAGDRDQGSALIHLQSAGVVDGFLLKPITAAATQLVMEAATRRYRNHATAGTHRVRMRTRPEIERLRVAEDLESGDTVEVKGTPRSAAVPASVPVAATAKQERSSWHPSWALTTVIAVLIAGAIGFWMSRRSSDIDQEAIVTKHLALAEGALNAGRLLSPRDGAAHHFQTVLAIDPQNFAALRGLDAVARELSKRTQAHMAQQRFADAAVSLARLRELQPDYAELPLLDAQLKVLQDALVASHTLQEENTATVPEHASEAPSEQLVPRSAVRASPAPSTPSHSASPLPEASPPPEHAPVIEPQTAPQVQEVDRETAQTTSPTPEVLTASIAPSVTAPAVQPKEIPSAAPAAVDESPVEPTTTSTPTSATSANLPALVTYVPPRYPPDAYARQMEGWVQVSMEIAPNGTVLEPRIEAGEKRQLFGRAALTAVRQWKYVPDANRAAGQRSTVRIDFKLQ